MQHILFILLGLLLVGCGNPVDKLRGKRFLELHESLESEKFIQEIRVQTSIPTEARFLRMESVGNSEQRKGQSEGIWSFEWFFILDSPKRSFYVQEWFYYDLDLMSPLPVKLRVMELDDGSSQKKPVRFENWQLSDKLPIPIKLP